MSRKNAFLLNLNHLVNENKVTKPQKPSTKENIWVSWCIARYKDKRILVFSFVSKSITILFSRFDIFFVSFYVLRDLFLLLFSYFGFIFCLFGPLLLFLPWLRSVWKEYKNQWRGNAKRGVPVRILQPAYYTFGGLTGSNLAILLSWENFNQSVARIIWTPYVFLNHVEFYEVYYKL